MPSPDTLPQSSLQHPQPSSSRALCSPRLDKATKAHIKELLRSAVNRAWCKVHGKSLPPPKLPRVVLRVIKDWFTLVDDDGSGTLEHHELLAALQAARIPCDASSITEMIKLIDANRDGVIDWSEFESFMMIEFAAGQRLLSGEFVLPSGMALPFGAMIRQLKRSQMIQEVTQGGEARRKWLHYDINLSADAAEIAQAEEAIRMQKEYNETLHRRDAGVQQQQQEQQWLVAGENAASTLQKGQLQHTAAADADNSHGSGSHYSDSRPVTAYSDSRPVTASTSPLAAAAAAASAMGATAPATRAALSRLSSTGASITNKAWLKPASVPRLHLGSLGGSSSDAQHSSRDGSHGTSRQFVGFLTDAETAGLLSRLPTTLQNLVGSPRAFDSSSGGSGPAIQPYHTARSSNGASANSGLEDANASGAGMMFHSARVCHPGSTSGGVALGASAAGGSSSSSFRRPCSASSGHHVLQPQPSRDEWRAVAASCLSKQWAPQCSDAGCSARASTRIACSSPKVGQSSSGACSFSTAQAINSKECGAGSSRGRNPACSPCHATAMSPPTAALKSSAGKHDAAHAVAAPKSNRAYEMLPAAQKVNVQHWEYANASPRSTAQRSSRACTVTAVTAGDRAALAAVAASRPRRPSARPAPQAAKTAVDAAATSASAARSVPQAAAPAAQPQSAKATVTPWTAAAEAPPSNDSHLHSTPRVVKPVASAAGGAGDSRSPRTSRQSAIIVSSGWFAASPRTLGPLQFTAGGGDGSHGTASCHAALALPFQQGSPSIYSSTDAAQPNKLTARSGSMAASAGSSTARQQQAQHMSTVRDASCKFLLSARATPAASLLSEGYRGPVETAVMAASTPRGRPCP